MQILYDLSQLMFLKSQILFSKLSFIRERESEEYQSVTKEWLYCLLCVSVFPSIKWWFPPAQKFHAFLINLFKELWLEQKNGFTFLFHFNFCISVIYMTFAFHKCSFFFCNFLLKYHPNFRKTLKLYPCHWKFQIFIL